MGRDVTINAPKATSKADATPVGSDDNDTIVSVRVNGADGWVEHRIGTGQSMVISGDDGTPLAIIEVDEE